MTICKVKNPEDGIEFAYHFLIDQLEKSEKFFLCISGGKTPEELYSKLNDFCYANPSTASKLSICWADERNVPYQSLRSNYGNSKTVFPYLLNLMHAPISTGNEVCVLPQLYEEELRKTGFILYNSFVADLVVLGMGRDGHTASIFPNTELKFANQFAAVSFPENMTEVRITLLPSAINNAKQKIALIFGKDKRKMLKEAINGNADLPFSAVIKNTIIVTDQDV
jgi:6-phosphogluconolactonase